MKAIASDLDGTLVFKGKIKKRDLWAISKFQKEGNLFGVCTGRPIDRTKMHSDLFHCDFIICTSGAMIVLNDKIIYEQTIVYDDIKTILEKYHDQIIMHVIHTDLRGYFSGNEWGEEMHEYDDIEQFKDLKVLGLSLVFKTEEETVKVNQELARDYPQLLGHQNKNSIDITSSNCSKGKAVQKLKELMNIGVVAAIGDSYNDISMIKDSDYGFTFHDAPEEVKQTAKGYVKSVSEAIKVLSQL